RLQSSTAGVTDVDLKVWQETVLSVCEEARKAEKVLSNPGTVGPTGPPPPSAAEPAPPGPRGPVRARRSYPRPVVGLVRQVAEAADALHERGILHRDIKPGNIMLSAEGGHAVLMDLGLAQLADESEGRLTRTRQFVGTLRYASPEQVLAVGGLDRRSD